MKFVIATGGTGGHLFPALMVSAELERRGHDVLYLGSFAQSWKQLHNSGFVFEEVGARGFTSKSFKEKIVASAAMMKAILISFRLLKKIKPHAVLGFGGYGAFPVVLSAVFLRYPVLIHEQNVVPGRANAILANFVDRIAISFQKGSRYFNPRKTVLTGCPCHLPKGDADRTAILNEFRLKEGKRTILVVGGSQGSQRINTVFMETAGVLKEKLDFQVIHISGRQDYLKLQGQYNLLGIPFALFDFLDKMEEAYHISDLVISRSGAVTVSEIAVFRIPAIFIPYPYAHGHQRENAAVLCEEHIARLIEDKELSASKLAETVYSMLADRDLNRMNKEICFPDAVGKLAEEAVCLAERK
ncbi:MAG: undecaprenyldiphospho-muramoylpentapeptide beta-N-acetylglucosaminyltransferase [Candidatus Omnitrophica bacterium]|nr:undecaprenyldiphospho-muramoylpentapeptide beta-N-acetylglucosaminyltransferase [Candidatus Omnitrophota bacterium]